MSRPPSTPKLPSIAVEDDNIKRSISIPRELDEEIAAYMEYFQAHSGKRPRSLDDVIVGLLNAYLSNDVLYQKWRRDRSSKNGASGALPFAAKGKAQNAPLETVSANGAAAA